MTIDDPLVLEHSVEADVSRAFAWRFRTDIKTWSDPPATFLLDGPFVEGSRGTTLIPGQQPLTWWIREVRDGHSFAIEMALDGATLCCEWRFAAVAERRTRITQRVVLSGSNSAAYREQVESGFSVNLAAGMERIAEAMILAANVLR